MPPATPSRHRGASAGAPARPEPCAIDPSPASPTLLIGATGLLGGAVGATLTRSGTPVRALLRSADDRRRLVFDPAEIVIGDLTDPPPAGFAGAPTLLYMAATSVPADSPADPAGELAGSLPALNGALRALARASGSAGRIIFPSSGGSVYGDRDTPADESAPAAPRSAYALGKVMAEDLVRFWSRTAGLGHDILRFSNVYGSGAHRTRPQGVIDVFLDDALADRPSHVWGSPDVERDFLFVDDAADAVARVAAAPPSGRCFNVAQGATRSLREVLAVIADVTEGRHRWVQAGDHAPGVRRSALVSDAFVSAYAWRPRWTLEDGVRETWKRKLSMAQAAAAPQDRSV